MMNEYLSPGVYVEDAPSKPIFPSFGNVVGAMAGITQRGPIGKAVFINSWDAYLREFAQGVPSPFMANSDLAYSVWGYFQNGGKGLNVTRVASPSAAKAKLKAGAFAPALTISVVDGTTPVITPEENQNLEVNLIVNTLDGLETIGASPINPEVTYKWGYVGDFTTVLATTPTYTVQTTDLTETLMVTVTYQGQTIVWEAAGVTGTTPPVIEPEISVPPVMEAQDEGAWGNGIKILSVENEDQVGTYNVTIYVGEDPVESYQALGNTPGMRNYWIDVFEFSEVVTGISGSLTTTPALKVGSAEVPNFAKFEGGIDGIEDITDDDYILALSSFDKIDDITLLALPGQTSLNITYEILDYVEKRENDLFAILDAPRTAMVNDVRILKKQLKSKSAGLFYPWIRVADPLSKVGTLREVPLAGYVMGVYARIMTERGVWKAPAGTEANIKGALEVVTQVDTADTDRLNPVGVISIFPKTNYGIVIWGARSISDDLTKFYVSDIILNIMIKKYVFNISQPFVFEPNNQRTWTRVETEIGAFLDSLWRAGGLFGSSAAEAYFVRCDGDLNPPESRAQGKLIVEVGYASSKPAEFVIIRINHDKPV